MKQLIQDKMHMFVPALFAAVVFVTIAYASIHSWNNHTLEKERAAEFARAQQSQLLAEKEQKELEIKLKEELRDEEIRSLKAQVLSLQNKKDETPIPVKQNTDSSNDVSDIVKEWSPRVAHVECSWLDMNKKVYANASGSATIAKFNGLGVRAVTSKHLFFNSRGISPDECKVELLSGNSYKVIVSNSNIILDKNQDFAYMVLPQDTTLLNLTKEKIRTCQKVEVGDSLLVLGYPKIGAKTGLTVTEGIVSGIEEVYYITSAKIDKGNSGGAAFLVDDDCYLGIPTAAIVGTIESLGQILKASFVIGS